MGLVSKLESMLGKMFRGWCNEGRLGELELETKVRSKEEEAVRREESMVGWCNVGGEEH